MRQTSKPMRCSEMVEMMLARGWWKTKGQTPAATLYAAILRERQTKGKDARFRKVKPGRFALNAKSS